MAYTTPLPFSVSPYNSYVVRCSSCHEVSSLMSWPYVGAAFLCKACGLHQTLSPDLLMSLNHGSSDQAQSDLISVKKEFDEESCKIEHSDSESIASSSSSAIDGKSLMNKKRVREIEEVEDCLVLDPYDQSLIWPSYPEFRVKDGLNIVVKAVKGEVVCRDYPHPRHLCVKHPYTTTPHYIHCKMCYCYVCDTPAPCEQWTKRSVYFKHCEATAEIAIWRDLRRQEKRIRCGDLDISSFEELVMAKTPS